MIRPRFLYTTEAVHQTLWSVQWDQILPLLIHHYLFTSVFFLDLASSGTPSLEHQAPLTKSSLQLFFLLISAMFRYKPKLLRLQHTKTI